MRLRITNKSAPTSDVHRFGFESEGALERIAVQDSGRNRNGPRSDAVFGRVEVDFQIGAPQAAVQ